MLFIYDLLDIYAGERSHPHLVTRLQRKILSMDPYKAVSSLQGRTPFVPFSSTVAGMSIFHSW